MQFTFALILCNAPLIHAMDPKPQADPAKDLQAMDSDVAAPHGKEPSQELQIPKSDEDLMDAIVQGFHTSKELQKELNLALKDFKPDSYFFLPNLEMKIPKDDCFYDKPSQLVKTPGDDGSHYPQTRAILKYITTVKKLDTQEFVQHLHARKSNPQGINNYGKKIVFAIVAGFALGAGLSFCDVIWTLAWGLVGLASYSLPDLANDIFGNWLGHFWAFWVATGFGLFIVTILKAEAKAKPNAEANAKRSQSRGESEAVKDPQRQQ